MPARLRLCAGSSVKGAGGPPARAAAAGTARRDHAAPPAQDAFVHTCAFAHAASTATAAPLIPPRVSAPSRAHCRACAPGGPHCRRSAHIPRPIRWPRARVCRAGDKGRRASRAQPPPTRSHRAAPHRLAAHYGHRPRCRRACACAPDRRSRAQAARQPPLRLRALPPQAAMVPHPRSSACRKHCHLGPFDPAPRRGALPHVLPPRTHNPRPMRWPRVCVKRACGRWRRRRDRAAAAGREGPVPALAGGPRAAAAGGSSCRAACAPRGGLRGGLLGFTGGLPVRRGGNSGDCWEMGREMGGCLRLWVPGIARPGAVWIPGAAAPGPGPAAAVSRQRCRPGAARRHRPPPRPRAQRVVARHGGAGRRDHRGLPRCAGHRRSRFPSPREEFPYRSGTAEI
jgi:hypothetical protein